MATSKKKPFYVAQMQAGGLVKLLDEVEDTQAGLKYIKENGEMGGEYVIVSLRSGKIRVAERPAVRTVQEEPLGAPQEAVATGE